MGQQKSAFAVSEHRAHAVRGVLQGTDLLGHGHRACPGQAVCAPRERPGAPGGPPFHRLMTVFMSKTGECKTPAVTGGKAADFRL